MPPSDPESDACLFEAVRAGEPGAWERFVSRFERLVFAVPLRMGLSRADAEEVFQDTWVILHRHLAHIREPASISSWILTTARRESGALMERRRRERRLGGAIGGEGDPGPLLEASDEALGPEEVLERIEEAEIVREALARLDERCRELLGRLYLSKSPPSYEELARDLGLKLGSVGPTRMRCLAKLAERLAPR